MYGVTGPGSETKLHEGKPKNNQISNYFSEYD